MNVIELSEKLSLTCGLSGFEDDVVAVCREYCAPFATFEEDTMRNLYIYPRNFTGKKPLVMLDAHSDEVGFMVQAIRPDGTLKFVNLGTWPLNSLPSSKVQVYTPSGYIQGVIATIPPHLLPADKRDRPVDFESLTIDVGATSAKEAAEFGVEIGAPVVPLTDFSYDARRGLMFGKAFDDRLGVAAMLVCLERLSGMQLDVDVVGVVSSQEEVGERGITAVCNRIKARAAICFEGCPADDTCSPEYMVQDALRGGVMLRHMDRSVICSPRFLKFALETAAKNGIKVQRAVRSGGGNNGEYIVSSNGGTPVIVAGIPVRYIHTCIGIAAEEDVISNINFGEKTVLALNEKILKGF